MSRVLLACRPGVALLIAGTLVTGPVRAAEPAASEPGGTARPEGTSGDTRAELDRLYSEGQQRFAADDFAGAIESFAAGLQRSPEDDPRGSTYFAVSLAIAHLEQHLAGGSEEDLARALELLRRAVDGRAGVLAAEPRLEALARRNLARAEERDRELHPPEPDPEPRPEQIADDPLEPDPEPDPEPDSEPVQLGPDRRRPAGLALVITGTVFAVGGLAIIIDGATLDARARAIAEDPPMGAQKDYIENEVPRLARIRYAIAGPVMAAGIGLLVGGGVLLRRANRGPRPVTVHPWVGRRVAGLGLGGSF